MFIPLSVEPSDITVMKRALLKSERRSSLMFEAIEDKNRRQPLLLKR